MTNLAVRELSRDQAVRLTQRIRDAAEETWALLMEAHEGRAWNAMGYGTWADYVGSEFGISRSRSYQLIDQAAVVRALEGAVSTDVDISEADERTPRITPSLAVSPASLAPAGLVEAGESGGVGPVDDSIASGSGVATVASSATRRPTLPPTTREAPVVSDASPTTAR